MCWCVDVLMCRCGNVFKWWCVVVVRCRCADVSMWWCVDVLMCRGDVSMCWCVDVSMCTLRALCRHTKYTNWPTNALCFYGCNFTAQWSPTYCCRKRGRPRLHHCTQKIRVVKCDPDLWAVIQSVQRTAQQFLTSHILHSSLFHSIV
jgi:hypothetical protein